MCLFYFTCLTCAMYYCLINMWYAIWYKIMVGNDWYVTVCVLPVWDSGSINVFFLISCAVQVSAKLNKNIEK